MVEGTHGTGKTTVLRQALLPFSVSGVAHLHVHVGGNGDVGTSLWSALKLEDYCQSSWAKILSYPNVPPHTFICSSSPSDRLHFALKILTEVAAQISEEDGIPPVVVFDNTAQILNYPDGLKSVHLLQDTAKIVSDEGFMIVLFASSESSIPTIMRSRSSISRLHDVFEVGDITDEEAADYLICMCPNATKDVIAKTVQLIGGRFAHLKTAVGYINRGEADQLQTKLFGQIKSSLASVTPKTKTVLFDVVQRILQSPTKRIECCDFTNLVSVLNPDDQRSLDQTNVLMIGGEEVAFGCSFIRIFCKRFTRSCLGTKQQTVGFLYSCLNAPFAFGTTQLAFKSARVTLRMKGTVNILKTAGVSIFLT